MKNTLSEMSAMIVVVVVEEALVIVREEYKHSYHLVNKSWDPYRHVASSELDEILATDQKLSIEYSKISFTGNS